MLLQEPRRGHEREGKRGDRKHQPADAQRRDAHRDGGDPPGGAAGEHGDEVVPARLRGQIRAPRSDARQRELAQRELPGQAGDQEHRDAHHGDGEYRRQLERRAEADQERQQHRQRQRQQAGEQAQMPHGPHAAPGVGDGTPALQRGPATLIGAASAHARLEQERGHDETEQDGFDGSARRVVPIEDSLDLSHQDTGAEGQGQRVHPGDDRGGQRAQHQLGTERLRREEALGREDQDRREGGEAAGDGPRQRRHASDRHRRQPRRVRVGGGGADGKTVARVPQEDRNRSDGDGTEHEHRRVRRRDQESAEVERGKPRRLRVQRAGACLGAGHRLESEQQSRRTERRHHAHEAGDVAEPPDHGDLGEGAGSGPQHQRQRQDQPVHEVPAHHRHAEQGGGERAGLAVGEVDDSVRTVDEHQAHGEEPVRRSRDQAEKEDGCGHLKAGRAADRGDHVLAGSSLPAPSRKTERTSSVWPSKSDALPSKRISPRSMK